MKNMNLKELIKKSPLYWRTFFILLCFIFIIKLFVIYSSYINLTPIYYCIWYFLTDVPVFLTFLLLIRINSNIKKKQYRLIIDILLLIICIHFFIDTFLILFFQSRALIPEIFIFSWEVNIWLKYLTIIIWIIILFFILSLLSFTISNKFDLKQKFILILFIIWLFCYSFIEIVFHDRDLRYFWNVFTLNSIFRNSNAFSYENYDNLNLNSKYSDHLKYIKWDWKNTNIILIFAESLSAIDSKKYWWYNNMTWFDAISDDWITYTNFVSNWTNSEDAHIATLLGVLPRTYNSYTPYNLIMEPLPEFLNKQWYNTTFISTVRLSFLKQRDFLENIWFKKIIWEEAFESEQKYTFNSAPDEKLYERILQEVQNQTWKYFIAWQTISFHTPYETPYWNSQESALKYSDEKLYEFYLKIKKTDFFNNWILIIIWDHRMMQPMKEQEDKIIWKNWYTKSVATIIWKGINSWETKNTITQHTDIYNSIKKLVGNWNIQIDNYFNDIFSNQANRNWAITINSSLIWWQKKYIIINKSTIEQFDRISLTNIKDEKIYEYIGSYFKYQDTKLTNWEIMEFFTN